MKHVFVYTDGSCFGNPGPGGWAALLRFGFNQKLFSGMSKDTTNNRMELSAIIMGMKQIKYPCKVTIVSDSMYCKRVMCKGGDKPTHKLGKKVKKNLDLVQDAYLACRDHDVTFRWVKGHAGHFENELVDSEAKRQTELCIANCLGN